MKICRHSLLVLLLSLLLLNCSQQPQKPNILLIMADDMGFSDLGCYGSDIDTPNINRLAQEGLRFTQFYNAARCCPTRASLLTGLYPHQAGMGGMVAHSADAREAGAYQGYLNNNCVTMAEVLKTAGYTTLMSGKWHVGEFRPVWPVDRGFDRYYGLISGAANYFNVTRTKNPNVTRIMAEDDRELPLPTDNFYMTDAITDHAVRMLQEYKENTFFHYIAYTAPHWPLHALPQDIEKYKGQFDDGWDTMRQKRYQRMIEMGLIDPAWALSPRDEKAVAWQDVKDKELMSLKMAIYAAQIDRMDQGIGKLLQTLEDQNRLENTLVIFLSDNGACHESGPLGHDFWNNGVTPGGADSYQSYGRSWANAGNTPFRLHKHWAHEGGIATPLIVRWPKTIKAGGITHQPGHIIDLMTTFVDITGAVYPDGYGIQPMPGRSLVPVFKGEDREPHPYLYWEHEGNRAIRHNNWKLVAPSGGAWELYDLKSDRTETSNLVHERPDMVRQLEREWKKWADRIGVQY